MPHYLIAKISLPKNGIHQAFGVGVSSMVDVEVHGTIVGQYPVHLYKPHT